MSSEKNIRVNIYLPASTAQQVVSEQEKRKVKHFATTCRLLIEERLETIRKTRKKRQPIHVKPKERSTAQ